MTTRSLLVAAALTLLAAGCVVTDPPPVLIDRPDDGPVITDPDAGADQTPDAEDDELPIDPIDPNNSAPRAVPGPQLTVNVGQEVRLDGSGSDDADGDPLTYVWTLRSPAGSTATLVNADTARPRFSPDVPGDYIVTLVVNDGKVNSAAASTRVTALADQGDNAPPTADAGLNREVVVGDLVTLDGTRSSDPDGDDISYAWAFAMLPAGSTVMLANPSSARPTFTPDVAGQYVIRLTVRDEATASAPATVTITASAQQVANQPPSAIITAPPTTMVGQTVMLSGANSGDPDGDPITYQWTLQRPASSNAQLSNPTAVNPSFVADRPGPYAVTLIVNDGQVNSQQAAAAINALQNNQAPVARAGANRAVDVGEIITLDGSASSDPDNNQLTYRWTLQPPVGSNATLDDATRVQPAFTVDVEGEYYATLIVNDGQADSAASVVTITASAQCLLISEYYEGSSNNKAIEVFNCGSGSVDLTRVGLCQFNNTSTACTYEGLLTGTLAPGAVTVFCHPSTSSAVIPAATCTIIPGSSSLMGFNGDDRLMIYSERSGDVGKFDATDKILDAFGELTSPPSPSPWADKNYRRCNATPYLGMGAFSVTTYFTELPISDANATNHLGVAPSLTGCP